MLKHPSLQNKTTDVVIHQHSRKLLKMDILMSETCWTHKKWNKIASDIKLVFYSSTVSYDVSNPCPLTSHLLISFDIVWFLQFGESVAVSLFYIQILTTIAMMINSDVVSDKFKTRIICVRNEFLTKVKRLLLLLLLMRNYKCMHSEIRLWIVLETAASHCEMIMLANIV